MSIKPGNVPPCIPQLCLMIFFGGVQLETQGFCLSLPPCSSEDNRKLGAVVHICWIATFKARTLKSCFPVYARNFLLWTHVQWYFLKVWDTMIRPESMVNPPPEIKNCKKITRFCWKMKVKITNYIPRCYGLVSIVGVGGTLVVP